MHGAGADSPLLSTALLQVGLPDQLFLCFLLLVLSHQHQHGRVLYQEASGTCAALLCCRLCSDRLLSISFDDSLRVWQDPAGPASSSGKLQQTVSGKLGWPIPLDVWNNKQCMPGNKNCVRCSKLFRVLVLRPLPACQASAAICSSCCSAPHVRCAPACDIVLCCCAARLPWSAGFCSWSSSTTTTQAAGWCPSGRPGARQAMGYWLET